MDSSPASPGTAGAGAGRVAAPSAIRRRGRQGSPLDEAMANERALGIRILLARPILDAGLDPEDFRVVARNREFLTGWFETTCGWALTVDVMGGFARLAKRSDTPDPTRPARRPRQQAIPFDRRRYELLCLICAELANQAITTVGFLAKGIEGATKSGPHDPFDATYQRERMAFVDAFKLLESWGVVTFSSGEVEAYVSDAQANAFVKVDTARLHRLLVSAQSPAPLAASASTGEAIAALTDEPRYGDAPTQPDAVTAEARTRWLHHSLARQLLDNPVLYAEDLTDAQRTYAAHPSGRRWLRERAAEAGLPLEERREGMMAIDPEGRFADQPFPISGGTVTAAALLLTAKFLIRDREDGPRRLVAVVSVTSLVETIRDALRAHPLWARKYQGETGAEELAREAIDLLASLGLVRCEVDLVRPMPALARYRATEPRVTQRQESLL